MQKKYITKPENAPEDCASSFSQGFYGLVQAAISEIKSRGYTPAYLCATGSRNLSVQHNCLQRWFIKI